MKEPRGLEQLLQPTCMVVLGKDGSVSLRWPSSPEVMKEYVNDIVSFAFLNDLPAFKHFIETISSFSKLDGNKGLAADWLKLMGPMEVDNIVVEALRELKRKCEQRLARGEGQL